MLYAMRGPARLLSFRTAKIEPWVARELDEMRAAAAAAAVQSGQQAGGGDEGDETADDGDAGERGRSASPTHVRATAAACVPACIALAGSAEGGRTGCGVSRWEELMLHDHVERKASARYVGGA